MALPLPPANRTASPFDDLIDVASRLTALMARESDCLARFDVKAVAAMHEEKLALSKAYCLRVHDIKKDPSRLAAVTAAVRDELKSVLAKFDDAAKRNEMVLRSAKDANDRVLKAVVDAAHAQAPRVQGYGRNGAMAGGYGGARAPSPPPL